MNKVLLHGRIAKDISANTTQSGQTIARLTVAVDRYAKAGEERKADFISCVAFGKTAEFLAKYFGKGKEILAEGRIQTGSYTDKDGNKGNIISYGKISGLYTDSRFRDGKTPESTPCI